MARILFVEDNGALNQAYKDKFTGSGFDVDIATDGDEAIAALKRGPLPDLIILDLLIPKRDGYQVLADVKKSSLWKKIPVVIASNLGEEMNVEKAKRMGALDYFVKSEVTLADLVHKVKNFLRK